MTDYDAIVIGSGFGGAITACRLAEAGYRVLILERGRRWSHDASHADFFPRRLEDITRWLWRDDDPVKYHGWLDLRVFPNMSVAQGAAVGGGSQIYANVSVEAPPQAFEDYPGLRRWPRAIRKPELQPYYDRVGQMLKVRPVPERQWSSRTHLMRDAAEAVGVASRFRTVPLAINFNEKMVIDPTSADRPSRDPTTIRPNEYGVPQGECYHCGSCDIGCDVNARNTLDTNYLPQAEKHEAEIRSLHIVLNVESWGNGYRVHYERIDRPSRPRGSATARIVILAAGSLGSTELLLRCRDQYHSLRQVSAQLGQHWTSNGDFLTPAFYAHRDPPPRPSEGPPISAVIDFLDRSDNGQSYWIQDGGFPNLLAQYAAAAKSYKAGVWMMFGAFQLALQSHGRGAADLLDRYHPFTRIMPWFAQAVDAGDGQLQLKRRWLLLGRRRLALKWRIANSEAAINAVVAMHKKLTQATQGVPLVPPAWSLSRDLITPHPLGGCGMADRPEDGVVNAHGEVFGHRNLYIADGAIFPRAIGVNPSRTIAALAERIAAKIVAQSR